MSESFDVFTSAAHSEETASARCVRPKSVEGLRWPIFNGHAKRARNGSPEIVDRSTVRRRSGAGVDRRAALLHLQHRERIHGVPCRTVSSPPLSMPRPPSVALAWHPSIASMRPCRETSRREAFGVGRGDCLLMTRCATHRCFGCAPSSSSTCSHRSTEHR